MRGASAFTVIPAAGVLAVAASYDADLAQPLGDRVRDQAVDADAREQLGIRTEWIGSVLVIADSMPGSVRAAPSSARPVPDGERV